MRIQTFQVNPLAVNCYVVSDPATSEAAIIDPGMFYDEERDLVAAYIDRNQLHVSHVLLTHGHFDHVWSCQWAYDKYGLLPELSAADAYLYADCLSQVQKFLHRTLEVTMPRCATLGAEVQIGSIAMQVIPTPGHTMGGVCYYGRQDGVLFGGDTIFQGSVGRTDLEGGDASQLLDSVRYRILALPGNTQIYPGHGPATNVAFEKRINPFA